MSVMAWPLIFLSAFVLVSLAMAILWMIQRMTLDASPVDAAWAGSIGFVVLAFAFFPKPQEWRGLVVTLLAAAWAFRLALYLLFNRVLGKEEDSRYRDLRASWGQHAQRNFFLFFQAQAAFAILFILPIWAALQNPQPFPQLADYLGICIWLTAVIGESIADRQLAKFRADPVNRGRTCRAGLWRFSRHPNYFFEWIHWFAYAAFAFGSQYFWLGLSGPILMGIFLFKVTGIPVTEERAIKTRGEDYRDYQKTTSMFIPWFPKKRRAG